MTLPRAMTDRVATRRRETLRQGTPVFIATGPDEIAFFLSSCLTLRVLPTGWPRKR